MTPMVTLEQLLATYVVPGSLSERLRTLVLIALFVGVQPAWSNPDPSTNEQVEQTLTGEVIAVWCYLREGKQGIGRTNANHQAICLLRGSPVAIKAGDDLYYLDPQMEGSEIQKRLSAWVGCRVTVRGTITPSDRGPLLAISHVERK